MKKNVEVIDWQKKDPTLKIQYNLDYSPETLWEIPAFSEEVATLPFYVQEVGLTVAQSQYYVKRSNLKSLMMTVIISGAVKINYNDNIHICHPGDAMWIDCMKPHSFSLAPGTENARIYYVHMYGSGALEYFRFFNQCAPEGHLKFESINSISYYFQKLLILYKHQNRDYYNDLQASALLNTMCCDFIENVYTDTLSEMPEYIRKIRKHLDTHYMDTITLDSLSQKFYLSSSYIQKKFKQYIGMSPSEYLLNTRISNAKKFLRFNAKTIETISLEVGFKDSSYFIAQFKKIEGITPKEYRKQWGNAY